MPHLLAMRVMVKDPDRFSTSRVTDPGAAFDRHQHDGLGDTDRQILKDQMVSGRFNRDLILSRESLLLCRSQFDY
jgi:hypothetical protein